MHTYKKYLICHITHVKEIERKTETDREQETDRWREKTAKRKRQGVSEKDREENFYRKRWEEKQTVRDREMKKEGERERQGAKRQTQREISKGYITLKLELSRHTISNCAHILS